MESGPAEPVPTATDAGPTPDDHAVRRDALRELAALIGQEVFY